MQSRNVGFRRILKIGNGIGRMDVRYVVGEMGLRYPFVIPHKTPAPPVVILGSGFGFGFGLGFSCAAAPCTYLGKAVQ